MPILLGYTGLSDASLKKYVEDSRAIWQEGAQMLDSTMICGVIGTHTGPGVVAAARRNFNEYKKSAEIFSADF